MYFFFFFLFFWGGGGRLALEGLNGITVMLDYHYIWEGLYHLLWFYNSFFIVAVGPSSDPYGLSIVDSLKIYVKTKDAFGYSSTTEQQAQDQDSESTPLMSPQPNESSIESVPTPLLDFSKPKSQTEK